ncbi:MAG: hypothetical protein IJJ98_08180 [Prevotella sp.]|nr:hypothetical protein [Prevotella sp.]
MKTIKQVLKKMHCVQVLQKIINHPKSVDFNSLSNEEKTKRLMDKYERLVGYRMDIRHPKTFTEKLQWYKLFYEGNGKLIELVDKYLFKQYIRERLGDGYTIPLYGMWTSIEDLKNDWDSLPEEFVLKSNLQSDGKFIKFIHKKSEVDFNSLEEEFQKWLNPKFLLVNGFCKAYHDGVPRIIAEQYLENVKDQLFDYKLFCFDGKPYCMYVATEHFMEDNYPITFYDIDWKKLDVQYGSHQNSDIPKPKHYDEMKKISEVLSRDLPFVRVDFFDTDDHLYVAELTLYPGGGYTPYKPESFNEKLGEMFKLPIDS